jgi:MoaA/NifB/PqqE/SkfB family radical SAM enzyme
MDTFWEKQGNYVLYTNKPFQIAIGSTGEPTIHPEFCDFLKTVYESGVVPNYTTNGIILSKQLPLANAIMEATRKYVGGVAVSFGNESIREYARQAVVNLINNGNTNVNIHHIISDKESVDEFVAEWARNGDDILYHVLLPLMPSGRSSEGVTDGTFEYLEEVIEKNNIKNVAFGAHFIKNLRDSKIKTWLYDEQSFSKNIILTKDLVQITPSSFDLNPIMTIKL